MCVLSAGKLRRNEQLYRRLWPLSCLFLDENSKEKREKKTRKERCQGEKEEDLVKRTGAEESEDLPVHSG